MAMVNIGGFSRKKYLTFLYIGYEVTGWEDYNEYGAVKFWDLEIAKNVAAELEKV